ncbi:hypothetical protein LCGC14_1495900 [marine sediment metagenome]|uniref:Uncharacterized protein n=1 Tax=marine sediment metagenome TaxID=412755 RepID=A0A0F9LL13_9ZZZZ
MATETGRILDLIAQGVREYRRDGGTAWTFHHVMTSEERLAFDRFLCETGDELAYRVGSTESRFHERVRRMVTLEEVSELTREAATECNGCGCVGGHADNCDA